ncbi:nicastrin-like [Tachypleus tridentatus]|uniref:nicastrin-like n=1 Tax=Tachypleus tridentatus TaxID=6853 RepID=UPI003FD4B30C
MTLLKNSDRVTGVIVLKESEDRPEQGFSPDQSCPNQKFGLYVSRTNDSYGDCQKNRWNPDNPALGMMFVDWGMPIFFVTEETSINKIRDRCYHKFNDPSKGSDQKWPLCAAEMKSVMLAAKDTETCMRRSNLAANLNPINYCDPLSGRNVVTTLFPSNKSSPLTERSVIVVGARIDTFSLFDNAAPGADSAVSGLVTLMATANALASLRKEITEKLNEKNLTKNESFDYIGSSRVVYDMQKKQFPVILKDDINSQPALIELHHISHFLELAQVAPHSGDKLHLWIHTDPLSSQVEKVNQSINHLTKILLKASETSSRPDLSLAPWNKPLPPASLQRFLRADLDIPGVVITNHKDMFTNKYYNSIYDFIPHINDTAVLDILASNITAIASVIVETVYELLTEENLPKWRTISELYEHGIGSSSSMSGYPKDTENVVKWFLDSKEADGIVTTVVLPAQSFNMNVLEAELVVNRYMDIKPSIQAKKPYSLYIRVEAHHISPVIVYTKLLLAHLTGTVLENRTKEDCKAEESNEIYMYNWIRGSDPNNTGVCVQSTTRFTLARSPAFELKDWTSTEYSTWTESVWTEISCRIFLKPSRVQEGVTFALGVIILVDMNLEKSGEKAGKIEKSS